MYFYFCEGFLLIFCQNAYRMLTKYFLKCVYILQCESIVEELEDDIISLFASETDHVAKTLCSEVSGICVWCDIPSFIHLSKHVNAEDLNHSVDLIPIVFNIFFLYTFSACKYQCSFWSFFSSFFSVCLTLNMTFFV